MNEKMDIFYIKVSLDKCGIAGLTNIFGRESLTKSIIFPKVLIRYRYAGEIEYNGVSKTYDL